MASRNRFSTAQPTPGRQSMAPTQSRAALVGELPPYRKPSHPLNDKAKDNLKRIYNQQTLRILQEHHGKAEQVITESAGKMNDVVREREAYVERRRRKWEQGKSTDTQEEEETRLGELKDKAKDLTEKLEVSMRAMIDSEASAQRTSEAVEWLRKDGTERLQAEYATQISQRESQSQSQRRQRRRDQEDDEDMDDEERDESPGPTPLDGSRVALTGPWEMYTDRQQKKRDEYTSISHKVRYAEHNSYIGFKKMVHDARYGDDGPQLPRPELWFTERGSPAPGITATQHDDDDDDIVMDKATISTKCPLTLQKFREPVTSSKCPHSFEKTAITDMIRGSDRRIAVNEKNVKCVKCPVSGCEQDLTISDLRTDAILLRKLKRLQEAAERQDSDDSDEETGVQDSQVIGSSEDERERVPASMPRHKRETMSSAPMPPSQVVDLGDGSEDEDE